MAINKNSNAYIIIYTVVMVVIVGALLAFLATSLKPQQDANVLNEQKVSIMKAFGEADANFDEVVDVCRLTGGELGVVADEAGVQSVFDLLGNRKALSEAEDGLPIFRMRKDDATKYVLPIVGKGLWGDIWGYVALQQTSDNVVITGIVMDHAGETPGLGARMGEWFRTATSGETKEVSAVSKVFFGKPDPAGSHNIIGRNIGNEGELKVSKDGGDVDAITASTITSRAFLNAVNNAYKVYKGNVSDVNSGATTQQ